MSEFKAPFQVRDSIIIKGAPCTITAIGEPEALANNSGAFVPVQLNDGSYRILYCSPKGVERVIESRLPELTGMIQRSQDMPAVRRSSFRTYIYITDHDGRERAVTLVDDIRRDEQGDEDRVSP